MNRNYNQYHYVVKIKNVLGYAILVLLLAFIVWLFRQEQMLRHTLRKKEKELITTYRLVKKSCISLLFLSTHAEIVITWDDNDIREYSRRRHGVCDSLQLLKEYVHTPLQKAVLTHCVFFFGIKKFFFPRQCILSMNCRVLAILYRKVSLPLF